MHSLVQLWLIIDQVCIWEIGVVIFFCFQPGIWWQSTQGKGCFLLFMYIVVGHLSHLNALFLSVVSENSDTQSSVSFFLFFQGEFLKALHDKTLIFIFFVKLPKVERTKPTPQPPSRNSAFKISWKKIYRNLLPIILGNVPPCFQ